MARRARRDEKSFEDDSKREETKINRVVRHNDESHGILKDRKSVV